MITLAGATSQTTYSQVIWFEYLIRVTRLSLDR
jgi:hypothetical protein